MAGVLIVNEQISYQVTERSKTVENCTLKLEGICSHCNSEDNRQVREYTLCSIYQNNVRNR